MEAMRTALAAVCVVVLLAAAHLSLSLPDPAAAAREFHRMVRARGDLQRPQSVLTLTILAAAHAPAGRRYGALGGAIVVAVVAVWRVSATLAGPHSKATT